MRTLLLLLLLAIPASAAAQSAQVSEQVSIPDDRGFRLHGAVGYPSVMALGVGWKTAKGTEVLVQGGGVALWAFVAGTAEVSASHDWFRRKWGGFHAGLAASLIHSRAFTIDCYGDESCEDFVQNLWLASPRVGARLRLDPRKQHGTIPYLDLGAGPQLGACRGSCPSGSLLLSAAVNLRLVLDFQRRPAH